MTAGDVEQVLVVPTELALARGQFRGLRDAADAPESWLEELIASAGVFRPRPDMERDTGFKQIIPYLVLRDGDRWFLMQRSNAGVDRRLHERFSVGVGGHLNPGDRGVRGGLQREWREEVDADFVPDFRFVGLLNDDDTDVGSVHLGAVYVADAAGRSVAIRETHKLSGAFAEPSAVEAVRDRLETWSLLVFEVLRGRAVPGRRGV